MYLDICRRRRLRGHAATWRASSAHDLPLPSLSPSVLVAGDTCLAADRMPEASGRRRITIEKIRDERRLRVTFSKRKNGLMKKAMELSVLCDCDVGLIVFSPDGRCIQYPRDDKLDKLLVRFSNMEQAHEQMSADDYFLQFGGGDKATDDDAGGRGAARTSLQPQANGHPPIPTRAADITAVVGDQP